MADDGQRTEAEAARAAQTIEAQARTDAEAIEAELRRDPRQQQEWLRQNNLMYGGLIGIGVVIIQPFLTAGPLDLPATISVLGFAVAIPILASLVLLSAQESFRGRATSSRFVVVARALGQAGAVIGVLAAFWHIGWLAGAGVLAGGFVALVVLSVGYTSLYRAPSASGSAGSGQGAA